MVLAERLRAEDAFGAQLGYGRCEHPIGAVVLAPDVDPGLGGLDRVGGDEDALEHHVGRVLQDVAVLGRARFGLVGVHDHVARAAVGRRHEPPFRPGREAGAAAAAQARRFHLVGDLARLHSRQRHFQRVVAAVVAVDAEAVEVGGAEELGQEVRAAGTVAAAQLRHGGPRAAGRSPRM